MTVKLIYTLSFPQYIKLLYCYMQDLGWRYIYLLFHCPISEFTQGGSDIGLFITLIPKVLFFGDFWLVGSFSWVSKRYNHYSLSTEGVILCIIIRDVNKFIGHCLSPLDSWNFRLLLRPLFFSSLRQLALK